MGDLSVGRPVEYNRRMYTQLPPFFRRASVTTRNRATVGTVLSYIRENRKAVSPMAYMRHTRVTIIYTLPPQHPIRVRTVAGKDSRIQTNG